ncbi:MAG TPA: flagellar FlbD family protein, partial [Nocardioidaceae bacterium]|nr:flagellar FlbD family protein [Nocardioidaceae bacterium]
MRLVSTKTHGGAVVILLTRLNGSQFGINADLIERVETTGDTVISLIDGTKYVVAESPADIVDR